MNQGVASENARCTRYASAYPIHLAYQKIHCITSRHERCPVFLGIEERPCPPEVSRRAADRRRRARRILTATTVVVALGLPFAVAAADFVSHGPPPPLDMSQAARAMLLQPIDELEITFISMNPGSGSGIDQQTWLLTPAEAQLSPAAFGPALAPVPSRAPSPDMSLPRFDRASVAWTGTPADEWALLEAYAPALPATGSEEPDSALATLSSWDETITWVMKSGDSLRAIAEDFDTTVAALETLNDFEPNAILLIGQKVLVPVGFRLPL
ncbi:MAG: LysM domain-containing protein [Chloroflexi bacterium]|nr:LysM domain-containing protein [Chloroflexota bacterium]